MTKRKFLVTGASSGIGQSIAIRLLMGGHQVLGLARDFSHFPAGYPGFIHESIDFSDLTQTVEKLKMLVTKHQDIDGLVCCAGQGQFGSLEEFSHAQIQDLMNVNFVSQTFVVKSVLPYLKRKGRGDIIVVGSESALKGSRKGSIYCASKFALRGFTQALRDECGSAGVRVSLINPGMVRTGFFDDLAFAPGADESNFVTPEDIADLVEMIIQARLGTAFDEINLSPLKKVIDFKKGGQTR